MARIQRDQRQTVLNGSGGNNRIGNADAAIGITAQYFTGTFRHGPINHIRRKACQQPARWILFVRTHTGMYFQVGHDRYSQTSAAAQFTQQLHCVRIAAQMSNHHP